MSKSPLQEPQEELKITLIDHLNSSKLPLFGPNFNLFLLESSHGDDQVTEDKENTQNQELPHPAGSQTTRCKRPNFFKKGDNFSKSEIFNQPKMRQKYSMDSFDQAGFKIKKRNKFMTYPRS